MLAQGCLVLSALWGNWSMYIFCTIDSELCVLKWTSLHENRL